jgi:hypothetical protein
MEHQRNRPRERLIVDAPSAEVTRVMVEVVVVV